MSPIATSNLNPLTSTTPVLVTLNVGGAPTDPQWSPEPYMRNTPIETIRNSVYNWVTNAHVRPFAVVIRHNGLPISGMDIGTLIDENTTMLVLDVEVYLPENYQSLTC
ncbi:hypothetical protein GGI25_004559 [Coemansia spiralis]|uniref:Uncharacterized protein n=2 Tax=Coemansia TaxID=4863 RepID=A0A9W8KWZ1_9FUNG|nr:hypothetical protein EDC05_004371 [Coemansia umbellata]KAJ2620651.1 hypothetical protein GGI26_004813 [Coemansia sp. RSA 1358]KAJ2673812.1 hypothetical protein GGI25_004559 [Coemansia spiralis]